MLEVIVVVVVVAVVIVVVEVVVVEGEVVNIATTGGPRLWVFIQKSGARIFLSEPLNSAPLVFR